MRKIISFVLIVTCFSALFSSCETSETYADKLKKERKAIKRILQDSSFVLTSTYPANGVFEKNQFYIDPKTGVYYHVVDSGGRKALPSDRRAFTVRYDNARFFNSDTLQYDNVNTGGTYDAITFTYGDLSSYTSTSSGDGISNYYFKSAGMVAPLDRVGEGAIVKLIIPFTNGSGYQMSTYEPIYIGYVKYQFVKGQGE